MNNIISQPKIPKIAALYARVSTARQEEQETIKSQLDEIKSRVVSDGNTLPEENIFQDDGWTGEMLERPGLDQMRDAASEGKFEILYVYDRGRVSRIFAYQEIILEEIANKGLEFVTLHDIAAHTPEEHVLQAMQGVFAQYERVKIAERFRRGKLHKARNGILINGQALYGYRYIKKVDKDTPPRYEINEEEARVVRMIFQWVGLERLSVYEVRRRLYQLKILPRKGRNPYWTRGPIIRLLRCESYLTGTIFYNKSEAIVAKKPLKHEKYKKVKRSSRRVRPQEDWIPYKTTPILENNGLFERVQEILDYYKKYQPKNKRYDYLLSGLVWCECGERRVGDGYSKGGNHYYRCIERVKKFPFNYNCKSQGVNAIIADGLLWHELKKFLTDKKMMRQQAEEWLKAEVARSKIDQSEQQRTKSLLQRTKDEEMRYVKAFGSGAIEEEQLRILLSELKKKKLVYEVQLREMESVKFDGVIDSETVDKLCTEAEIVLKSYLSEDKKKVVQDIIEKVTIFNKGEVRVAGHLPQFTQYMGYELERRYCRTSKCGEVDAV